jgi:probable phosphoglycerate mutase
LVGGHGDPPLDPVGHDQALLVADRLARLPLDAIYVSNLQRTAQTAAPLAERTGLTPVVEPDLREVFLGDWEGGVYRIRAVENHPEWQRVQAEQTWDLIPGAEQSRDLGARVGSVVNKIAANHPDGRVAVFAHGGVIGMLAALATGGRMFAFAASDNASITHLVVHGQNWLLRRFNDTVHLGSDLDYAGEQ